MATMTIKFYGDKESKRTMETIIALISQQGYYSLPPKDEGMYVQVANRCVQFGVITRDTSNGTTRFYEGPNFAEAKLKGPFEYIRKREKELNPSWIKRQWEYFSNNPLLSGVVGGVIGSLLIDLIIYLFTSN